MYNYIYIYKHYIYIYVLYIITFTRRQTKGDVTEGWLVLVIIYTLQLPLTTSITTARQMVGIIWHFGWKDDFIQTDGKFILENKVLASVMGSKAGL